MTSPKSRVCLKEIAAEAKVSVAAVSMALTNSQRISLEVRRRVWAISRRLGYQPLRRRSYQANVPTGGAQRIGFAVLGESFRRTDAGLVAARFSAVISQMSLRLESVSYEDVSDPDGVSDRIMEFAAPFDGLLLMGYTPDSLIDALHTAHIPFVIVGGFSTRSPVDAVDFDHTGAARAAAAYLLSKGHRRIGFLCGQMVPGFCDSLWHDGYRLALLDAGVPLDPKLMSAGRVLDGGLDCLSDDFLTRPDAYVVVNPVMTDTLSARLRGMGRSAVVCGVHVKETFNGRLNGFPCTLISLDALAERALQRLMAVCQSADTPVQQIIVPVETHNMS